MLIIINKNMSVDRDIFQYFGGAIYRFQPPTFRAYKLYVISGFNLILKRTKILSYFLIQDETFTTYNEIFKILKKKFEFNPKLFNMDFNKAYCKVIKNYKHIPKYGLNNQNGKNELYEFLYNL